jgi:hypothetical protein
MNKSLLAIATATCALATITTSSAQAGFKIHFGFGGFGGFHHHHHHYRPLYVVRPVQPKVYVARKAKPVVVKQDEDAVAVAEVHNENSSITLGAEQVASAENSSITSAAELVKTTETQKTTEAAKAIEPIKAAEEKKSKPAVAQKLDCKKFFPSVGLTLTVPCE